MEDEQTTKLLERQLTLALTECGYDERRGDWFDVKADCGDSWEVVVTTNHDTDCRLAVVDTAGYELIKLPTS